MADDRPADTATDQLAALQSAFDDFRSTMLARVARCPTGDIEPTIRTTPKPDTLLMQGQAVNRGAYPVLWQWVQDQALVAAGLFTVGDGSTTFGIPDFRGRVPVGAGTLAVGALVGADSVTLSVAQLPSHGHAVSVNSIGDHGHGFGTSFDGDHGGHFPTGIINVGNGAGTILGLAAWNSGGSGGGGHAHTGGVDLSGNHTHGVTQSNVGSGTAVDNRPASIAVNWLVYT